MCECLTTVERRGRAINRRASAGARLAEVRARRKGLKAVEDYARWDVEMGVAERDYFEARMAETMADQAAKEAG